MKKRIGAGALVGIVGMALVFAACGSSKGGSSASSSKDTFGLSEFTIVPPTNRLDSGRVTISANNLGGEVHELVIVRAASAEALPNKSDGSVDEGKIARADKIGEITDVAAGSSKSKSFDLAAGTYVAICNIIDEMADSSSSTTNGHSDAHGSGAGSGTGHVHFSEGMHLTFTVG